MLKQKQKYTVGEEVEVFYRMRRLRGSCLASTSVSAGLLCPRIGMSDGWQAAVIVKDPDDVYGEYLIRYLHLLWFDRGGRRRSINSTDKFDHEHVAEWQIRLKTSASVVYPPPLLSVFVMRWGGFDGEEADAFDGSAAGLWGHAGTSVCDKYINAITDSFESCLGTNFEITTAFVQYGNDLEAVGVSASFIRAQLKGAHVAGLYFLWPVAFQDKAGGAAGMVPEKSYFQAVQRLEMTGLPTRFPHPSHLYRLLVSKDWTSQLCLRPDMHIPATTKISIATAIRYPYKAADAALKALFIIQHTKANKELGDTSHHPWRAMKGVLKLGFSWEALDVLSFHGIDEMVDRLGRIAEQPGCLADYIFVQEFIESDCEFRCYVLDDGTGLSTAPSHIRYTRPGRNNPETGRFEGFQDLTREVAISEWYGGNEDYVVKAEAQIESLIKRWKIWLLCESSEIQPYMRFDFFVKKPNLSLNSSNESAESGDSDLVIYTGEMTELGGSTLNWQAGPSLIFRAVLGACLEGEEVPPANSFMCVRKYEATHVRFNSDDDDDDDEGDMDDEHDDSHEFERKETFYETEKLKYIENYNISLQNRDSDSAVVLKKTKF